MAFTQGRLVENCSVVPLVVPINTTGAAQTGTWINLKYHRRVAIIIQTGAWAGGTSAVTLKQATDTAGSGAKSLSFSDYYAGSTTVDRLVKTTVSSDTYNLSAASKVHVIEIHANDLDLDNGFTAVQLNLASPGSNADYVSAVAVLYDADYYGSPALRPSSL